MLNLNYSATTLSSIILVTVVGCTELQPEMTNDQVISATCSELDAEKVKLVQNAAAHNEGKEVGFWGGLAVMALEGYAASETSTPASTADFSGSASILGGSEDSGDKSKETIRRGELIDQLRIRKHCP